MLCVTWLKRLLSIIRRQAARRNHWMTFVDTSPEKFYDSLLAFSDEAGGGDAEVLL